MTHALSIHLSYWDGEGMDKEDESHEWGRSNVNSWKPTEAVKEPPHRQYVPKPLLTLASVFKEQDCIRFLRQPWHHFLLLQSLLSIVGTQHSLDELKIWKDLRSVPNMNER